MVNVAGRSKGCNTCRQRKLACSLEKPHCRRCINSKLLCSGYKRERIFILDSRSGETKSIQKLAKAKHSVSASQQENGEILSSREQNFLGNSKASIESTLSRSISWKHSQVDPSSSPADVEPHLHPIQQAPAHVAHRQQLLAQFLHSYMPVSGRDVNGRCSPNDNGTWLFLLPSLQDIPPALTSSVLALCTAFVGRRHADAALVQQSLVFHGRALRALQKTLWDSNTMYKDETLAACIALTMYEATECPGKSNNGWTGHMDGCAKLIQHRGAEAHTGALGHRLFLWFRISGLMESIVYSRPTYLSDPKWISVPWRDTSKPLLHQLIDITSLVAKNFVQLQTLETRTPANLFHTGSDIVSNCWEIEASLRHFYTRLTSGIITPPYWTLQSMDTYKAVGLEHDTLFPISFHFANLSDAYILILYWATEVLLWLVLSAVYLSFGTNLPPDFPAIGNSLDIVALSHNICRSVPYFLQDSMGTLGASLLGIPLIAVIETLKNVPGFCREVAWAKRAMHKVRMRGVRLLGEDILDR